MSSERLEETYAVRLARTKVRERIKAREARLRPMGFASYDAYINSPEWKALRDAYWRDPDTPKTCAVCGACEPPLILHHKTYERVGAERFDDLAPVGQPCHVLIHELEKRGEIGLDFDGLTDAVRAAKNRAQRSVPERHDPAAIRERHLVEEKIRIHRRDLLRARTQQSPAGHHERRLERAQRKLARLTSST